MIYITVSLKQFVFTSLSITFQTSCMLKNRLISFFPIVDKYIELYQTGKLRLNQTFLQILNIKETKFE